MWISKYCTEDTKKSRQLEYWNEVICKEFTELECRIGDKGAYRGELTRWDLESIQFAKVSCDPSGVHHSRFQVSRSTEEVYLMHVQTEGESLNTQSGREAHLKPGDFTLCTSGEPYSVLFDTPIEMLVLRIPVAILRQYFSAPEADIIAQRVSSDEQLGSVIYSLLLRLWANKQSIDNHLHNANICNSILSLLATQLDMITPSGRVAESSVRAAHIQRIRMYIERHLSSPDLSPGSVAHDNGVSPRYLRVLFEMEGVTCSRYIMNRRLEEVARDLSNPMAKHMKITEIAYRWGFNSPSHFSRNFKEHFRCSPLAYRESNKDNTACIQ